MGKTTRLRQGINDLRTWCKENNRLDLLDEWNYEENEKLGLTPDTITAHNSRKVWWKCLKCQNTYPRATSEKLISKQCPVCTGHYIVPGVNDLETWCKQNDKEFLIEEWDYEKNYPLTPQNIAPRSGKKVWWRCRFCGYERLATPCGRVVRSGCKRCNIRRTSFPEQAILYYAKQCFPEVIHNYSGLGFEIDVYIPSIKTAIEYDGIRYHEPKTDKEIIKNKQCIDNEITLIRIREEGLCSYDDCICIFRDKVRDKTSLNITIPKLFSYLGIQDFYVDVLKDNTAIIENYRSFVYKNSLAVKFPELAKQWHPTKNGNLKPENFTHGSNEIIWWLCPKCGYEWQTSIGARTGTIKRNCPCCAKKIIVKGINDFETWCKRNGKEYLLNEWDYEENAKLGYYVDNIAPNSSKKVWWVCQVCGNKRVQSLNQRVNQKPNCKKCNKHSHGLKKVRCIETGEVFESITSAIKKYNIRSDNISACCKGKRNICGGYHWEYAD